MVDTARNIITTFEVRASKAIADAKRYERAIRDANKQNVVAVKSSRNFGNAVQQASIQTGDFLVQVGMGQNPMRAFAQQANQLSYLMSGPWGIAFTLATGLLAGFGAQLFSTTGESDDLTDSLRELQDQADKLRFGVSTAEELEAWREIEKAQQRINTIREQYKTDNLAIRQSLAEQWAELRKIIVANQNTLLKYEEMRDRLEDHKIIYSDIYEEAERLRITNEDLDEVYDRQLKKQREHLGLLQSQGRQMIANINANPDYFDPRGEGRGAGDVNYRAPEWNLPPVTIPPNAPSGGGRGGGIGKQFSDEIQTAMDAWKAFDEETRRQIESTSLSFQSLTEVGVDGFVDSLFDAETSFKDFARSFLVQIGKMIAKQLILNTLTRLFGGGEGMQIVGGVSTAIPPTMPRPVGFAKGGVINAPTFFPMGSSGMGVAGEAGPEAIMPLKRGGDGSLGVGGPKIEINNYTGQEVSVDRDARVIRIAVGQAVAEVAGHFAQSVTTGQGTYARALDAGYSVRRKF